MFQDGSWKPIYFGVKRSKVKATSHKNVSAGFFKTCRVATWRVPSAVRWWRNGPCRRPACRRWTAQPPGVWRRRADTRCQVAEDWTWVSARRTDNDPRSWLPGRTPLPHNAVLHTPNKTTALFSLLLLLLIGLIITSVQCNFWQKATSSTCHPSRLRMGSFDLDPIYYTVPLTHMRQRQAL